MSESFSNLPVTSAKVSKPTPTANGARTSRATKRSLIEKPGIATLSLKAEKASVKDEAPVQSRRQNQGLKLQASQITPPEQSKTSQNGVRAILRVQGNALPPTAEVIKIKLASTSATIDCLMKDFRDKNRNPRFNRSG